MMRQLETISPMEMSNYPRLMLTVGVDIENFETGTNYQLDKLDTAASDLGT